MTRRKNDPVGQIAFRNKLTPAPNELTDEQIGKIDAYLRAHPGCGWKAALGSVGFYAPREQAKALILASADLAETRWASLGVTEGQLTNVIGDIAADSDHKDQLRAALAGLKLFHGYSEQPTDARLDVNVAGRVEIEDRSAPVDALYRVLESVGALDGSPATRRVLPAASQVLAAPEDG